MYSQTVITLADGSMATAVLLFLGIYLIKGIVMFIPIQPLYLVAGALFGLGWGTVINIAGVVLCLTVPWYNGRFFRSERLAEFTGRYPALAAINNFQAGNRFLLSCLVRTVGLIPCDAVSLYCGMKGIPYLPYIAGSVLGMLPGIVLTGILGANIRTPGSSRFTVSLLCHIFTIILSVFIYNRLIRNTKEN